jgi:hypothetical protein
MFSRLTVCSRRHILSSGRLHVDSNFTDDIFILRCGRDTGKVANYQMTIFILLYFFLAFFPASYAIIFAGNKDTEASSIMKPLSMILFPSAFSGIGWTAPYVLNSSSLWCLKVPLTGWIHMTDE